MTPCPFCGESNLEIVNVPVKYYVFCNTCETLGPTGTSEQEATDKWNTRLTSKKWTYDETMNKIQAVQAKLAIGYISKPEADQDISLIQSLSGWNDADLEDERIRRM